MIYGQHVPWEFLRLMCKMKALDRHEPEDCTACRCEKWWLRHTPQHHPKKTLKVFLKLLLRRFLSRYVNVGKNDITVWSCNKNCSRSGHIPQKSPAQSWRVAPVNKWMAVFWQTARDPSLSVPKRPKVIKKCGWSVSGLEELQRIPNLVRWF